MESKELNLKDLVHKLRQELENDKQYIHECKKKIQSFDVLQKEYLEEIDNLNMDKEKLEKKLEAQQERFAEEKLLLNHNFTEEIQITLKNLAESRSEIEKLKGEIAFNKKTQKLNEPEEVPQESIDDLKNTILDMQDIIHDLNDQLRASQKQCDDHEETEQELRSENNELLKALNLKREEVARANELNKNLQDDIMHLKSELNLAINKPLDEETRGNSLFSEIYDSRTRLKKQLKIMMEKYNQMTSGKMGLQQEIELLRMEKYKLIQSLESDLNEYRPGGRSEIENYKFAIEGLRASIESYEQELEFLRKTTPLPELSDDLKYYEIHFENKEKEMKSLRQTLDRHITGHVLQARLYAELGREKTKLKFKAIDLETENEILKNQIKVLEGKKDESNKDVYEEAKENHGTRGKLAKDSRVLEAINENIILKENSNSQNIFTENSVGYEDVKVELMDNPKSEIQNIFMDNSVQDLPVVKRSVKFSDDTKVTSEGETMRRRGAVVIKKHLPITHYAKTNKTE